MSENANESKVEQAKRASAYLRGTIAQTLAGAGTHFSETDAQLLKFHGSYQQYDRDARQAGGTSRADRVYSFMVRVKIPGGVLTAGQYLALDRLADEAGGGGLRITSRQGCQFHGVGKGDLRPTIAGINTALLATLGACGDVARNVMACPAPLADGPRRAVRALAGQISRELCPRTRAYHEIWLDGEKLDLPGPAEGPQEPFYGDVYLPRKFKIGVTLPDDNSIDVYSQDVGLVALPEHDGLRGVNLLVGGGFGMTHGKADTFARKATPLGYVAIANAVEAVRTIAAIFRDHGNRADRRHARLKYLLEEWGTDRFRDEFCARAPFPVEPSVEIGPIPYQDYVGAHPQGDGRLFYGLIVENGRVRDFAERRLKTGLRTLITELRSGIIFTPAQNLFLTDLDAAAIPRLEALLDAHDIPRPTQVSNVRRFALACPALPTCGLALADAERVMPGILDEFESELQRLGLADAPITIRMTGCPNGCARPYTADIAFVGRSGETYNIYVGGRLAGDRLVDLYAEKIARDQLLTRLRPLLEEWRDDRQPGEGFGDFYQRVQGRDPAKATLTGAQDEGVDGARRGPAEG